MSNPRSRISTRPLELDDVPEIEAWLSGTGLTPPLGGVSGWKRMLADPRIRCTVGIGDDGRAVGFYRLDLAPDATAEVTIAVASDVRRLGHGTVLLDAALRDARELGLRRLVAVVAHDGGAAREFFAAVGFERTGGAPPGFARFERLIHTGRRVPPIEITP